MEVTPDRPFFEALQERYVVERELGRGGMATVYLASEVRHRRPVALKVLRGEVAAELAPESNTGRMCGCWSRAAMSISWRKRSGASSAATSPRSTFRATGRRWRTSLAR